MKSSAYPKLIILLCLLVMTILSSCRCNVEDPQPLPYNYMNVPEGDTAIVEDLNITGMGARKNLANTTWIIKGKVVMDHLKVMGHVIVDENASLNILGTLNVEAIGAVTVKSELKYSELKQNGKLIYCPKNKSNVP